MADIELSSESVPATPASGATTIFVTKGMKAPTSTTAGPAGGITNTTNPGGTMMETHTVGLASTSSVGGQTGIFTYPRELAFVTDAGTARQVRKLSNTANANDSLTASAVYLQSRIMVPPHGVKIGNIFRWRFVFTKTDTTSTATEVWDIRAGGFGNASDTARCTFTFAAQTAVTDTGLAEVVAVVRSVGTAGVLCGAIYLTHVNATTGIINQQTQVIQATSAGFDMTVFPLYFGVAMNGNTSFVGKCTGGTVDGTGGAGEYAEFVNL